MLRNLMPRVYHPRLEVQCLGGGGCIQVGRLGVSIDREVNKMLLTLVYEISVPAELSSAVGYSERPAL